jgi:hypothetical protein
LSAVARRAASFRTKDHLPPADPAVQSGIQRFEISSSFFSSDVLAMVNDDSDGSSTGPSVSPWERAWLWRSSTASSRSALTASPVFTWRTRWMPPRRSSPSLMPFFNASESGGFPGPSHSFFACEYPVAT